MYPSIRVRTAPPVSVRVRVSVSFSVTVLCLQLWRCIFLRCPEKPYVMRAKFVQNFRIIKYDEGMAWNNQWAWLLCVCVQIVYTD